VPPPSNVAPREERQDGASERVRDGLSVGPKCGRERFIAIRLLGRKHYQGVRFPAA
jgi:hypothetical protein